MKIMHFELAAIFTLAGDIIAPSTLHFIIFCIYLQYRMLTSAFAQIVSSCNLPQKRMIQLKVFS